MCPSAHRLRRLKALAILAVFLTVLAGSPASGAPPTCPLKLDNLVLAEGTDADWTLLVRDTYGALYDVRGVTGFKTAVMKMRDDVVVLFEVADHSFDQTIGPLIKVLGKGQYTREEMALAIIAANDLRSNGVLFLGVIQRSDTKGASSWLKSVGNRGHLYEVMAARNLIRENRIVAANVRGMGIRAYTPGGTYLVEGDIVEAIAGGDRFIDFKAASGNYNLDEVERAFRALDDGIIREFIFAHETGAQLPGPLQAKINSLNERIAIRNVERAAQGQPLLKPIDIWDSGPFSL